MNFIQKYLFYLLPSVFIFHPVAFSDPPAGTNWEPIKELTDEFSGNKLDSKKWNDHNPDWKGRKPGYFSPQNVVVKDGELHLVSRVEDLPNLPDGYHTFTTAAVRSKNLVRYGYFEIRCNAGDSRVSSAFWFYHNTPEIWTEIDVFEIGAGAPAHENKVHTNVHVFHSPTIKKHISDSWAWEASYKVAEGYHVYGLEWDEEQIKWYVDDKLIRIVKNEHWHQPLYMNFDSETMPNWFGLPKKENLPATFSIDYVRSWKKAEKSNVDH